MGTETLNQEVCQFLNLYKKSKLAGEWKINTSRGRFNVFLRAYKSNFWVEGLNKDQAEFLVNIPDIMKAMYAMQERIAALESGQLDIEAMIMKQDTNEEYV